MTATGPGDYRYSLRKMNRATPELQLFNQELPPPTPRNRADEEEPIGKISPATLPVASRYAKAEVVRIFSNKFRPENLYKLRHLYSKLLSFKTRNYELGEAVALPGISHPQAIV